LAELRPKRLAEIEQMSEVLPALRRGLDVIPLPETNRPGLLLRDPLRYTDKVLFIPPPWTLGLRCLDGEHTQLDIQEALTRATGTLVFSDAVREFVGVLQEQGFLETEEFYRLRDRKQAEFQEGSERLPVHAGQAYPASASELRKTLEGYFDGVTGPDGLSSSVLGVAAPHVSPLGGRNCYAATYRRLAASPALAERTFVVLGTSHFGAPEKFGLTRKPFVTPLGTLQVDIQLVDWLEQHAGEAISREDYCHAIEHSIEFQCVFLRYALGSELKIVPILCGPFAESLQSGRPPETNAAVARFFEALQELAQAQGDRLFWVLGIDLAHVGRRYGDPFAAVADRGTMAAVAEQDQQRLESLCQRATLEDAGDGDLSKFFELLRTNGDELKWCGYSALYTFARAVPRARGRVLRYEQWNIDPQSVVSFASVEFFVPQK
jgi:MEMO1 family protein